MMVFPCFPDPDTITPISCPLPGCAESLQYAGSRVVISDEMGYTQHFGKAVHLFSHDGAEPHSVLITTDQTVEETLDRLGGTLDAYAAIGWCE